MTLHPGLYDKLVTKPLEELLARLPVDAVTLRGLSSEEAAQRLSDALAGQLTALLSSLTESEPGSDNTVRQLAIVNGLLAHLRQQLQGRTAGLEEFAAPPRTLTSVHGASGALPPPHTGLAHPWLFTAGKGSPSLLGELQRELASSDQVDILVSFITRSGVRKLFDVLESATAVDAAGQAKTRVRVLTTTYTGATEADALDYLARLPGCAVKVSFDGRRTRLHAKAWIFQRRTGFGSAYVGSANLSGAALLGGLEWTVKFTQQGQESLFTRASAHFETLWNDSEFQPYRADDPELRDRLQHALRQARTSGGVGESNSPAGELTLSSFFDLEPKDYQAEMLEQLTQERHHGRFRNLVVAATGTGKTVLAAFDYRETCRQCGGHPRLLFVAHRREILVQAQRTFREVLRHPTFGELLADGSAPESNDHLFATIDSVCSRSLVGTFGAGYWHTVILDECHRLAADRFDAFARSIRPKILLGLTATPERADGKPILGYFDNHPDGSPAVELRLWHALDRELLAPFEYYGCHDETDFSAVPWDRPGEREAVDRLVTGNDLRAHLVINEWARLAGDPKRSRALLFCVSVAHAEFMTRKLLEASIPAVCVVGTTEDEVRRTAPARLLNGEISALVTCDLYNEGVDLPSVDTLLLLRPTQSPVLFQQQIGRGLRLHPGKQSCLVLDFVGRHRAEFRFDRLLSALTGLSRGELIQAVDHGFSALPPGCHVQLDRISRQQVLDSLRVVSRQTWRRLTAELQAHSVLRGRNDIRLADFLSEQSIPLEEVYRDRQPSGWTALRRDAGLLDGSRSAEESYFGRRYADLLHVDDPEQAALVLRLGEQSARYGDLNARDRLRLQALAYQIDGDGNRIGGGEQFLRRLDASPEMLRELGELAGLLQIRSLPRFTPIPGLDDVPLCLHAAYGIREILTSVGWLTAERRAPFQAGVLRLESRRVELLFVTLDKSEGYHDAIAYQDYAISPERFHWQSQNSAGPETEAGLRYTQSPGNGWSFQLFVRASKNSAYRACGPGTLLSSEGAKPMSIVWRLTVPLPATLFREFSILGR